MPRQLKPRTRAAESFTEAQYWGFIRSGLRSKWVRYPVRYKALERARRTVKGKRWKYEYKCFQCQKWYTIKKVEVDHIIPCGSLKCYEDLPGFVERLFCELKDVRVVCKECHKKITYGEKNVD